MQHELLGKGNDAAGVNFVESKTCKSVDEQLKGRGERGRRAGESKHLFMKKEELGKVAELAVKQGQTVEGIALDLQEVGLVTFSRFQLGYNGGAQVVSAVWGLEEVFTEGAYEVRCAQATASLVKTMRKQWEGVDEDIQIQISRRVMNGYEKDKDRIWGYVPIIPYDLPEVRKKLTKEFDYDAWAQELGSEGIKMVGYEEYVDLAGGFQSQGTGINMTQDTDPKQCAGTGMLWGIDNGLAEEEVLMKAQGLIKDLGGEATDVEGVWIGRQRSNGSAFGKLYCKDR